MSRTPIRCRSVRLRDVRAFFRRACCIRGRRRSAIGERCWECLRSNFPNREIDKVVSGDRGWERDGLGNSGDSGIVGPDYLLRSNARGFLQRREEAIEQMRARGVPAKRSNAVRAYGSTVLQQQVRLPSVRGGFQR